MKKIYVLASILVIGLFIYSALLTLTVNKAESYMKSVDQYGAYNLSHVINGTKPCFSCMQPYIESELYKKFIGQYGGCKKQFPQEVKECLKFVKE